MAKYTVRTPVPGFSGRRTGVMFHNGSAVVDDADPQQVKALAYFRRRGYTVEQADQSDAGTEESAAEKQGTATDGPDPDPEPEPDPEPAPPEPEARPRRRPRKTAEATETSPGGE